MSRTTISTELRRDFKSKLAQEMLLNDSSYLLALDVVVCLADGHNMLILSAYARAIHPRHLFLPVPMSSLQKDSILSHRHGCPRQSRDESQSVYNSASGREVSESQNLSAVEEPERETDRSDHITAAGSGKAVRNQASTWARGILSFTMSRERPRHLEIDLEPLGQAFHERQLRRGWRRRGLIRQCSVRHGVQHVSVVW